MLALGIETSCDETSVAVVEDGRHIRANVVSSQARLHERFGGVVPEIASRAHLSTILPVLDAALAEARCRAADCEIVAVTHRPGLIGALLVGVTAAKALAFVHGRPVVPVDHLQAHLYALRMAAPEVEEPMVALLVSGGHTALYRFGGTPPTARLLGRTLDDAAGEAFDKVAKLLGLGYPGGPAVQRVAAGGDPRAVALPRAFLEGTHDFSFSGLKTAVLYHVRARGGGPNGAARLTARETADVAAGFQQAVVDVLVRKTARAAEAEGVRVVGLAGGVAANGPLREAFARLAAERGWTLVLPPFSLCTDNAAMVAGLGTALYVAGAARSLDFDAYDHATE